ncbi:MAG: phosphatidylserine decarboxylase [Chloroflexi bacterium OHK40]
MPEQTATRDRSSPIPGLSPEATPILGLGLGLTGLALGLRPRLVPLPLALTALAAALYRDPNRVTPSEPGTLFAPADGVVLRVDETYEHRFVHSDCLRIAVAIAALDVPVCRCPAAGTVGYLEHVSGEYRPASDPEAAERNERLYIGVNTDWGPLLIALLAGPLARRISCRVQVGDRLEAGARVGTVRFGARADLYVQRDVVRLFTAPSQRLTAGITRIGEVVPL